ANYSSRLPLVPAYAGWPEGSHPACALQQFCNPANRRQRCQIRMTKEGLLVPKRSKEARDGQAIVEPEKARQRINQWTAEQTDGKIREIVPQGLLHEKIRFVLTNASYFKGTWQYRFTKAATRDAPFHDLKNREVKIPMMNQTGAFQYGENADLQILELPYVGGDLSMVILLPKQVDGF